MHSASALADDVILDVYLAHLTSERRLADRSVDAYASDLRYFVAHAHASGMTLLTATAETVASWSASLTRSGVGARAQNRKISALRGLYRFLIDERHIEQNPMKDIASYPWKRVLHEVLSQDDVTLILAAPDTSTPRGLRDRAMLGVLVTTSIKANELVQLTIHDVSCDMRLLRAGKRFVALDESARAPLATYLGTVRPTWARRRDTGHLFLTNHGRGMTRQGLWKLVTRHALAALQKSISPEGLRRVGAWATDAPLAT